MADIYCLQCGKLLELNDQTRHNGLYYCSSCKSYSDYNYLNQNYNPIQIKYMIEKNCNNSLLELSKELNQDYYNELEAIDIKNPDPDDKFFNEVILPIWFKIEGINKDVGLYDSHKRLGNIEHDLINWFKSEIKNYCLSNNLNDKWDVLKELFESKFICIDPNIRRKVLKLAESYQPQAPELYLNKIIYFF